MGKRLIGVWRWSPKMSEAGGQRKKQAKKERGCEGKAQVLENIYNYFQ